MKLAWASLVLLAVLVASLPGGAQDISDEIDELREEQEQVQAERDDQAGEIDAVTAEADDLAAALEVLNTQVNTQTTEVEAAQAQLDAANTRHTDAIEAVDEINTEMADMEARLEERAISAFVDQGGAPAPLLKESDPNTAVRMQSLVEVLSGDDLSLVDELRTLREDLDIEQAEADDAAEEAGEIAIELEGELAELETKQAEQAELAVAAEARLEAALAEAAALEELDAGLSAQITEKNDELAAQAALASRNATSADDGAAAGTGTDTGAGAGADAGSTGSGSFEPLTSASEIVNVQGIWVHIDIADNLDGMLTAATAAGHNFTGGGYRDPQAQIRLRKAHCGTSQYAIYQMPASQCSPPTARPGSSNHERGKAIDIKHNGSLITSRSNSGFQWLAANAASYGFYNLPSEPWHWSVDGR